MSIHLAPYQAFSDWSFKRVKEQGCREYEACHFTLVQSGPPQKRQNKSAQQCLSYHTGKHQELWCNYSWGFTADFRNFCIKSLRLLTHYSANDIYMWIVSESFLHCECPGLPLKHIHCINIRKPLLWKQVKASKDKHCFFVCGIETWLIS